MKTLLEGGRGAVISKCGNYRYSLWRVWDSSLPLLGFCMLNPSTADANNDDPTIARCCERARLLGFGGIHVVNLFAFRATNPRVMKQAVNPVGPENDAFIFQAAVHCEYIICGWGKDGLHRGRAAVIRALLPYDKLRYLKLSESTGQPWHPLYIGYDVQPKTW